MAQLETIINHVDAQQKRLYDPLRRDVDILKDDVQGNGKLGLKRQVLTLELKQGEVSKDLEEIKIELKGEIKKLRDTLLYGGVVIVVLQIVLKML